MISWPDSVNAELAVDVQDVDCTSTSQELLMTLSALSTDITTNEYVPLTASRGRFVILQGRGDDASYYERLGRRISSDGYTAYVPLETVKTTHDAADLWNDLTQGWHRETPIIALTVDSSAGYFTHAVSNSLLNLVPDALVLTGIALQNDATSRYASHGTDELALRSACPIHRAVVKAAVGTGQLLASDIEPIDPTPPIVPAHTVGVLPSLIIHGSNDDISPVEQVRSTLHDWTKAELVSVHNGLHDVLNDVNHRTVSGEIIAFAERLRLGADAPNIVTKEAQ